MKQEVRIRPLDAVFRNVRIADVFRLRVFDGWFGTKDGRFLYVEEGDPPPTLQAERSVDGQGYVAIPGLIDSHMHIECGLVLPRVFAEAVVPHGTTAVLADPHEVANVAGEDGVRWFMSLGKGLPLRFYWAVPSLVPIVSSDLETPNAILDHSAIERLASEAGVLALGEVHNYRGVAAGDEEILALGDLSLRTGLRIEGHNPSLLGMELSHYGALGALSDHTLTFPKKIHDELSRGFFVMLQQKSITPENVRAVSALPDTSRILLVTDDIYPSEFKTGHLSTVLQKAMAVGMDPLEALASSTIRPAGYLGLHRLGAIAPGRWADFSLLRDLDVFPPVQVYSNARLVAENGTSFPSAFPRTKIEPKPGMAPLVPGPFEECEFKFVPCGQGRQRVRARVIGFLNKETTQTGLETVPVWVEDGFLQLPEDEDICLFGVVSRQDPRSRSIALLKGFGLRKGAFASSFAHDAHNLMVFGRDPLSLSTAANAVHELGGGIAVAEGREIRASLGLPVLGLLSSDDLETVVQSATEIEEALLDLGATHKRPLLTLTFMTLVSSPSYKLTDRGIVDVEARQVIEPYIAEARR